jgi:hypothetical protein
MKPKLMKHFFTFLCCIALFSACEKERIVPPVPPATNLSIAYLQVDSLVRVFKEEAQKRSKIPFFEGVTIKFLSGKTRGTLGYSWVNGLIELDSTGWYLLKVPEKEYLLFHQLGHETLLRDHYNKTSTSGEYYSIMHDGLALTDYTDADLGYLYGLRRKYYLDELFDKTTPAPDWLENPKPYNSIKPENKQLVAKETFDDNRNNWNLNLGKIENGVLKVIKKSNDVINSPFQIDTKQNFEIEFEAKIADLGDKFTFTFAKYGFQADFQWKKNLLFFPFFTYPIHLDNTPAKPNAVHKYTIRKVNDQYFYYIDEAYIYVFDAVNYSTKQLIGFVSGDSNIEIDNFSYAVIP